MMKKIAILLCLFAALLSVNAESYISINPKEAVVDPEEQVPFIVGFVQDGVIQQVLPWDFKFTAQKGEFSGSVFLAPKEPGTYVILVSYKDVQGIAMVTVKGTEPVKSIEIVPPQIELDPDGEFQFKAKVLGQSGKEITFMPAWGAKGGNIDENGKFTAGKKFGKYTIVALGSNGAKASAEVIIRDRPTLQAVKITASSNKIYVGDTLELKATGYDQDKKPISSQIQWNTTGGNITPQGVFSAQQPGEYEITATSSGVVDKVKITVIARPLVLSKLEISPNQQQVFVGGSVQFSLKGYDQNGAPMEVRAVWKAKGGKIDNSGTFTAGNRPGVFPVLAAANGKKVKAAVKVIEKPSVLTKIEISPSQKVLSPGQKVEFSAVVYDDKGQRMNVPVQWIAKGGEIDPQGVFVAGNALGKYTIMAKSGDVYNTALIEIVATPSVLTRIEITPGNHEMFVNESVQLKVNGLDQNGSPMFVDALQWSCQGGSIDQQGNFTANVPGEFVVVASALGERIQGRAKVVVKVKAIEQPQGNFRLELLPKTASLHPQEQIEFLAKVLDSNGLAVNAVVEWRATGGSIVQGKYIAGPEVGSFKVTASNSQYKVSAEAEITITKSVGHRLSVNPKQVTVKPGEKVRYQATLYAENDQEVWTWPWEYTFSASRGSFQDTVYQAPNEPGIYKISIRHPKAQTEAIVIVEDKQTQESAPQVYEIKVNQEKITLDAGASYKFFGNPVDRDGNSINAKLLWKADGGKITPDGTYTAGDVPGTYTIEIWDPKTGAKKTIEVTIRVTLIQNEHRIVVAPSEIVMTPGESHKLTIKLYKGQFETWTWPWEFKVNPSDGQYVEKDSVYIAPQKPGTYTIEIKHEKAEVTVNVEVKAPRVSRIVLSPSKATVKPGKSYKFKVKAFNGSGSLLQTTFEWGCTGGSISSEGIYHTGPNGGTYKVWVEVPGSGVRAESIIRIVGDAESIIRIVPENPKVSAGDTIRFKVLVQRDDKPIWVWPWDVKCSADAGSFDKTTYTAPQEPGVYNIKAQYQDMVVETQVTVEGKNPFAQAISRIEIFPRNPKFHFLQKHQFTAKVFGNNGKPLDGISLQWQAEGGNIDENGNFFAGSTPGRFRVSVIEPQSGIKDSIDILVVGPTNSSISEIVVEPQQIVLRPGQKHVFKAFGKDKSGERVSIPVTWSASGGNIDQDGTFVAGSSTGKDYMVWAKHSESGLQGSASLGISDFEAMQLKITPENAELRPGEQISFEVTAYDIHNNSVVLAPRWFANGGVISKEGAYTAGSEEGSFQITAIDPKSYLFVKASIEIKKTANAEPQQKGYFLQVQSIQEVVKPGENVTLKPTLLKNNIAVWTWPWEFTYKASGGAMVGEYGNTWVAPNISGEYTININHRDANTTLRIRVKGAAPQVNSLRISPKKVVLSPGEKKTFSAQGLDRSGSPLDCSIKWSATGGIIDQNGNFQAGTSGGTYNIFAESGEIKEYAVVVISDQTSAYQLGREWGRSLRNSVVTRFQVKRFISSTIFTKTDRELEQFNKGFVDSYGPAGVYLMKEFLCHVASDYGKLYGHDLYWGNMKRSELVYFVASYIKRLPPSCHHTFKRGFLNGYKHFRGSVVYQKVWKDALKVK